MRINPYLFQTLLIIFLPRQSFCSEAYAQRDSTYIQSYYSKFIPKFTYTYKTQDLFFTRKASDDNVYQTTFSTGNQFLLGLSASYKWVNLGYSMSLNPNVSKQNTDFRVATGYRPFQVQFNFSRLRNLDYSLMNVTKNIRMDTIAPPRENGVDVITSKLKVDYVLNYKKYGYSAGFTQGAKQLKSCGSFILSGAISNDRIVLDHISDQRRMTFDSINGFTGVIINGLDVGFGYGYNRVTNKNWTLSFVELPKIAFQFVNTDLKTSSNYLFTTGFVNHFKIGILYTHKNRFFTGLSAYNLVNVSKIIGGRYVNVYNAVDIHIGVLLDVKK